MQNILQVRRYQLMPEFYQHDKIRIQNLEDVLMQMNINEIMEYLPQRYPMLLVDKVEEMEPGERAIGYKYVTMNEPYFQGHFPKKPVMPGVFVIDALGQLIYLMLVCVPENRDKYVYWAKLAKAKFYDAVIPGSVIKLDVQKKTQIDNLVACVVRATVEDKDVFTAEMTMMIVEDE